MWSAHFFVTHIQTEKLSSWNGPTVHVCCFVLARASTKTFFSRIHIRQPSPKNIEKIFVSRKIRQQGHPLAGVSLYFGTWRRVSWRKFTEYSQEDIASILKGEEVMCINLITRHNLLLDVYAYETGGRRVSTVTERERENLTSGSLTCFDIILV